MKIHNSLNETNVPLTETNITLAETQYRALAKTNISGYFTAFNVCREQEVFVKRLVSFL